MIYDVYDNKNLNNGPEPTDVNIAEGFNGSYGIAEAMLESAKADMAMFEAMMKVDAMEMKIDEQIKNLSESISYAMNETEAIGKNDDVLAIEDKKAGLKQGTFSKIIEKIKAGIRWLVGKIKAAATILYKKFVELTDRDIRLIKKHGNALMHNANDVNQTSIKWAKVKKSMFGGNAAAIISNKGYSYEDAVSSYKDDNGARRDYYGFVELDEYIEDTAKDTTIGAEGGISYMLHIVGAGKKSMAAFAKSIDNTSKQLGSTAKAMKKDTGNPEDAAKAYKMFQAYKEVVLKNLRTAQAAMVKEYKQTRAAVVKAIGGIAKTEACILEFMVEEAEAEVDDVFDVAINKDGEDITDISVANANVLDNSVSNDPEALVYDKVDSYSQEAADLDYYAQPLF